MTDGIPRCPYKGLMPYERDDWEFFFGRKAECGNIAANLRGSRLTVLYGPSGVGKSSVLAAGVCHDVEDLARGNRAEIGRPGFAIVHFRAWRDAPIPALLAAVRDAVNKAAGRRGGDAFDPTPPDRPLDQALEEWAERLDGTLLIVLDQFEEYFLYHPRDEGRGSFADELARAVTRRRLQANFLVSIREDTLAKLDRFEATIPQLFDNYLRIDRLTAEQAREAIDGPIKKFKDLYTSVDGPSDIGPGLADAVLDQVRVDRVKLRATGRGVVADREDSGTPADDAIDTSYLQLVMERLWEEERRLGSRQLRLETLEALGGSEKIVRGHLDKVLGDLGPDDRDAAGYMLCHLVTPAGSKIAQEPAALAKWTGQSVDRVRNVLHHFQQGRILRRVEGADRAEDAYELFHDVLARVVLDKVAELEDQRAQERARQEAEARAAREKEERERAQERARQEAEARRVAESAARRQAQLSQRLWIVAGFALLLALVAGYQAWRAGRLRAEAEYAAFVAEESEKEAKQARKDAETNASLANDQARIATSRRLAALSASERNSRLDLSLLLAVEALRTGNTFEARASLYQAVQDRPNLTSFLHIREGYVSSVAFSRDGKTLAAGYTHFGGGGGVVLWDAAARRRLADEPLPVKEGDVSSVAFGLDGKTLATGYGGKGRSGVLLWDLDLESWQQRAAVIANRNFTREEWRQYFSDEQPYRPTFPELPVPPEATSSDATGSR
jgi:hypothetical protein